MLISPFKDLSKYNLDLIDYPLMGKTCCHGLVDSGFLKITGLFFDQALTQSGTILFSDQSPPPITFPALAIAIFNF